MMYSMFRLGSVIARSSYDVDMKMHPQRSEGMERGFMISPYYLDITVLDRHLSQQII